MFIVLGHFTIIYTCLEAVCNRRCACMQGGIFYELAADPKYMFALLKPSVLLVVHARNITTKRQVHQQHEHEQLQDNETMRITVASKGAIVVDVVQTTL